MLAVRFIVAVLVVNVAYRVLGVSVAVDDTDSDESIEINSKEVTEDASELTKASKSLNETSIIKLRDVSSQLQKLKSNVSDVETMLTKARNSTSEIKQSDERSGPCARTTCYTKNGTTTCTLASNCTTTRLGNSTELVEQAKEKSTTTKSPISEKV